MLETVEPLAETRPEVEPECPVLAREPPAAEAEDETPAGQVVERRRELRGQAGIAEGVGGHEQAEPRGAGQWRQRGEGRPALELGVPPIALVGEQVVVEPQAVEACPFGRQAGVPKRRPVGSLDPEGSAESHGRIVGT